MPYAPPNFAGIAFCKRCHPAVLAAVSEADSYAVVANDQCYALRGHLDVHPCHRPTSDSPTILVFPL